VKDPKFTPSKKKLKAKREYIPTVIKKVLDKVGSELEDPAIMTEDERARWFKVRYALHQT
jgi:hypothetical protein